MNHPAFNRSYAQQVAAAADVLRNAYNGGSFIVDPEAVARAMLAAAFMARGCWLTARLKTGERVRIQFEDKGDAVPGFDKNGNRFEAYTSWMRFVIPATASALRDHLYKTVPGLRPRPDTAENYSQTDRQDADASGDVGAFRWKNDLACLEGLGVDAETVEIEPEQ